MEILFSVLVSAIAFGMIVGIPTSIGLLIASRFSKELVAKKRMKRLASLLFVIPSAAYMIVLFVRAAMLAR